MKTPPPDRPFDPDDPNFDPWADDPNAPKEPGVSDDSDIPWDEPGEYDPDEEAAESEDEDEDEGDENDTPPPPIRVNPTAPVRGPVALLDSELRGEIEFEILFQQTKAELLKPPPGPPPGENRRNLQLLAASAVMFLLSFWLAEGWRWVGLLVGVVALHELGHFLAMRAFGYRDVKMFFVPFFGATVPDRPEATATWKRAVTYLMGPLPGLLAAAALYFAFQPPVDHGLFQLVRILVLLNAFNLLPVVPLDGGRILEALFLDRRPWTGTVFRAFAVAVMVALVVWVDTANAKVILGMIALFTLVATPLTHRQARSRKVLAGHFPTMPEKLADVSNDTLRELFGVSLALARDHYDPARLAAVVRDLHAQAATRLASPRVAAPLVGVYLFAWALAAATLLPVARAELARDEAIESLVDDFRTAADVERREPEWSACVARWRAAEPAVRDEAFAELDERLYVSPTKHLDYRPELRAAVGK